MKNIMTHKMFAMVALWLTVAAVSAQQITLDDVVNYKYYPKSVRGVKPMADGESSHAMPAMSHPSDTMALSCQPSVLWKATSSRPMRRTS